MVRGGQKGRGKEASKGQGGESRGHRRQEAWEHANGMPSPLSPVSGADQAAQLHLEMEEHLQV